MIFLQLVFFSLLGFSLTEDGHKRDLKGFHQKLHGYEVRMDELKKRKFELRPGDELDDVLTEIADLHRETLNIKKRKRELKAHLKEKHPTSDLSYDIGLYRQTGFARKRKKAEGPLDKRLDSLLVTLQTQYSKYMTYKPTQERRAISLRRKPKKGKESLESQRKEYLREHLKTEFEINEAAVESGKTNEDKK